MIEHRAIGRNRVHAENVFYEFEVCTGVVNVRVRDHAGENCKPSAHDDFEDPFDNYNSFQTLNGAQSKSMPRGKWTQKQPLRQSSHHSPVESAFPPDHERIAVEPRL